MVAVRIYMDGERTGPLFRRAVVRQGEAVRSAARAAAQDAADLIEKQGAQDISQAGKFGSRWTSGLHATVSEGGGNIRINVTHDVPYFSVFLTGKVIRGNPWLYFPPTAEAWGLLHPGEPVPLLIRKEEVVIPRKFRTDEIARDVARQLPDLYWLEKKRQQT